MIMPDSPILHKEHEIDPVVTTARLNIMKAVRENSRRACLQRTGRIVPTPLCDAAIERLEELLAVHLPVGPGGVN